MNRFVHRADPPHNQYVEPADYVDPGFDEDFSSVLKCPAGHELRQHQGSVP
jgi:hypothetical protein